jgi:hypothetical protein
MIVLALNCGSSSLKFRLGAVEGAVTRPLGRGLVERIGGSASAAFEQEGRPPLREYCPGFRPRAGPSSASPRRPAGFRR